MSKHRKIFLVGCNNKCSHCDNMVLLLLQQLCLAKAETIEQFTEYQPYLLVHTILKYIQGKLFEKKSIKICNLQPIWFVQYDFVT